MYGFCSQHKRGALGNCHAETDEETGSNEHGQIDIDGLKDDTKNYNNKPDHNASASAKDIGSGRSGRARSDPTDMISLRSPGEAASAGGLEVALNV
jgi:hypothetical protein